MTRRSPPSARFLSIRAVAQELAVTERTVWRWIADEKLPVHRLAGTTVRIARDDLEVFIAAGRQAKS